jgi:hypothetical protein
MFVTIVHAFCTEHKLILKVKGTSIRKMIWLGMEAHIPSYLEEGNQKDDSSRPAQAKS